MGQVLPYADLLQAVDLQGHEGHVVPGQLPVQHPLKGQLRNSSDLVTPFARLSTSERTPLINLPKTWASSENESLKIIRNRVEFIINLKPFLSMNCPQSLSVIVFLARLVLCIISTMLKVKFKTHKYFVKNLLPCSLYLCLLLSAVSPKPLPLNPSLI